MNEKELIHLLRTQKKHPVLGGDFSVQKQTEIWNKIQRDIHTYSQQESYQSNLYSWKNISFYFLWIMNHSFLRPIASLAVFFMFIFSGSLMAANAAFQSIPGDALYPVKLVSERVQLGLTANSEKRARLQVGFANRRLQEMKNITRSVKSEKEYLVREAAQAFQREMEAVNESLQQLRTQEPETAIQMAKEINEQVDGYHVVIQQSQPEVLKENQADVKNVLETVEAANQQAVEVIVSQQESQPKKETKQDLDRIFRKDVSDIQMRKSTVLERLKTVQTILVSQENDLNLNNQKDLQQLGLILRTFDEKLTKSMDIFAAGGYRRAFDIIYELKGYLGNIENYLTDMEIEMSTNQELE